MENHTDINKKKGKVGFVDKSVWITLFILLVLPFLISKPLATEILIYGLFALAFNLLLGHTGMLSFGHAAYFGLGAYAGGMALRYFHVSVWTSLVVAMMVTALVAAGIGALAIKRKVVYFAMISLAFGQMFYFMALSPFKKWTGGEDGLKFIPVLKLEFPFHVDLTSPMPLYYFTYLVVGLGIIALWRILDSPFGRVLKAIRENEVRTRATGYNVVRAKFLSLVISTGSTTTHIYRELLGQWPEGPLACGMITGKGLCVGRGMTDFLGAHGHAKYWYFEKGTAVQIEDLDEVLAGCAAQDVFMKGANAIDSMGRTGVLLGMENGGTMGKAIGHVIAKGIHFVIPVGLEKTVIGSVSDHAEEMGIHRLDYCSGMPVGLMPLSGEVITEMEAMEQLARVEAFHVAAGGVSGGEGSVMKRWVRMWTLSAKITNLFSGPAPLKEPPSAWVGFPSKPNTPTDSSQKGGPGASGVLN